MSSDAHVHPSESGRGQGNAPTAPERGPSTSVVLNPATGELLDVANASTTDIADWRLRAVELKRELDAMSSDLDVELARRLDAEGRRSARVGDYELTVPAPSKTEYDVERLGIALEALVRDGRIARGFAERCIKVEIKRSAKASEVTRMLAHVDPEVRAAAERICSTVPNARRVSVRRVHP